ncbi:MAG: AhpC/TSA family protein [Bacteroidales bacterium]|nr:AhpC/TSA family protein [Bacteroidales bacterium]
MKRFFSIILIAAAALSCSSNSYTVKGTITPTDDIKDALVILHNEFTDVSDTAVVVGGKFSFKGEADPTALVSVALNNGPRTINRALFVPEAGTITIDLDSTDRVQAGPLTESLHELMAGMNAATDAESFTDACDKAFKDNKDNAVGYLALMQRLFLFDTPAELDEYVAEAADFIKNDEQVSDMRTTLDAQQATAAGCQYKDIQGTDAAGNPLALSAFVGKGKYVLIDFWASWCGPCRAEIPNLIEVDKAYAKKGVQVIGINVWDKRDAALRAVEQMGMKYPIIFTDDKTPTDDYGISGIPQILLIGPDGTILQRNLRGSGIADAIDKYVK